MRLSSVFGILAVSLLPHTATSGEAPVLVELFTSQGCSSCPPADAFLGEISKDDNVLALAFHVDYWDRLGWADTFGHADNTNRQYAYATTFSNRSVWTPQFVVNGTDFSKGNFRAMVKEYVAAAAARPETVMLTTSLSDDSLTVQTKALSGDVPKMDVIVAHFSPTEQVKIKRGENAGRTLTYHNIVNSLYPIGRWNGDGTAQVTVDLRGPRPLVVFVQERDTGPIHASAVIR